MHYPRLRFVAAVAGLIAMTTAAAGGPADTVLRFNQAISERDLDTALAQLADGSVQIQLRAPHKGMGDDPPLTGDLLKTWQMVGAIVFPTTNEYRRELTVTSEIENGDVATVWADTVTTTRAKNAPGSASRSFSELYLLVLKDGRWKIAASADNRSPDDIPAVAAD